MVNMKSDPKPKSGSTMCAPDYDEPAYPYGLRLCLNTESLEKLGLETLPAVGTKMHVMAMVEVVSTGQNADKDGGTSRNLDLQITDMDLGGKEGEQAEHRMYPSMNT